MYDVNVSWYSKMLVFQLGGRGFGGGGSGVRQYWDRHTLNGHWCKQMGWLRVDMTLCCYVLLVQKLKSLVRWWIYRCKRRILISGWTQIETHRWTTGSIQAWGPWGSWWPWRSWGSLHSRLTLLRDLELQPAMLDRASPHWPCQHNNLTLHCK